jgi:molybdopterin synthase catalytic subunit
MTIYITQKSFKVGKIIEDFSLDKPDVGAVVSFTGYVREFSNDTRLSYMFLEHYPGMTESSLELIESLARQRWELNEVSIIHRVGKLLPNDLIVAIVVSSKNRGNAFQACEFIIDFLKTDAPFWKKEVSDSGESWVKDLNEDHQKKENWSSR